MRMAPSAPEIPQQDRICILLPVLNEAENIEPLLSDIDSVLKTRDYEVCVLDDGSRDGTLDILARLMSVPGHHLHLIRRQKTLRGSQRGGALKTTLDWALSDPKVAILVEMDGDRSHRPEELMVGLDHLERGRYDVVIASKYLEGSSVTDRPWGRRMVSLVCNMAVRALLSRDLTDYSNGFRFYRRNAAEAIAATSIRYTSPIYLTEVVAIWLSRGFKIGEYPTHYVGRNEGVSKLRLIDLAKASLAIFEVATRLHLRGFAPVKATHEAPEMPRVEA
jgi:dolichol-phosphate mannosyltransferase